MAREAAGVRVDRVTTEVKVRSTSGDGAVRVAEVDEHSGYPVEGSKQGTSTKSRHRFTFEWSGGRWAVADVVPLDEKSNLSDRALASIAPDEERRAAIRHRIEAVRAGITANLPALRAADTAKLAGKQVVAPDALKPSEGKGPGGVAVPARPADRPFAPEVRDQVHALGGEGRPYDYQTMINVAWYYATEPVPYTRDVNDCTTFISWVLWNGRYEERGSESYPETLWNYDDADVWYYRCNDCSPRHTYTWGGALNWNVYENNYGGRVTFMPYLSDLLLSDVFQMEMNNYGDPPGIPDHTTMVTGRGTDGWPLLSYHSRDTRDKGLWDVIGAEDGPFWAIRT
ncbi:amidase domain-containing protein [Lentzea albida]|uniref:Putative amidase domain-containing protein n=1 Tax=Lentzea albida TaxID=65499 RepID=A0A1H9GJJ2_9PSEU|nr:amidase domain-containing protein [Lentzea albida]SEQ50276.1 Putative amidase domain-containing protein [Lentzea albida]